MATLGIKDIAALAKVSPATVSRVFSSPDLVSEKTLHKVKKVVDELGYRPNRMGANLRTRKSGNIVAIIPDITKPVNAGIIRAIEKGAQNAGYSILLGDTQGVEKMERHYADMVTHGQADGILLFGSRLPFKVNCDQPLRQQLPPLVNGNEGIDSDEIVKVAVDNVAAAKAAVNYLVSMGHRRIAAITGPKNIPSSNKRVRGYYEALEDAGIERDDRLLVVGRYDVKSGVDCAEKLLQINERPTAVFCFNDDMAIGAMQHFQQQGLKIPDDISVMGFDDINYAEYVSPSLSTVHQPLQEIGEACINLLLKQLRGEEVPAGSRYLPYTLMIRNSTGVVPKQK
ncbi:LacI family DNA-binding transcriptional regulator [Paraglaciecola aquimarina]|uniref:LacI family DNA-binding transcriptional regulator n=1 Tax=Paraglaciecola aquimarina TaxID=1235557 RepID=A0ABU3SZR1_9ALTE|nr:LacI family DNA-binding transcriptional regulator [Paraglaciecola aquimarina]MDU0355501.1 LacI family DNA-binding transcriptional regulator [Paraglaciecola aquimarina]